MNIRGRTQERRSKERKKKPDELLTSVVTETAIGPVVELLRGNEAFVFPSGTSWVMLLLETVEIGGLSKKQSKDEAKGSIIELIQSDRIQTAATADMLELDIFGIIPTDQTISRMEEYSLLSGAMYDWAVVWLDDAGEMQVEVAGRTNLGQVRAVSNGSIALREVLPDEIWQRHSGEVVGAEVGQEDHAGVDYDAAVYEQGQVVDEVPFGDDASQAQEEPFVDQDEPVYADEAQDEPVYADEQEVQAQEQAYPDEEVYEAGHVDDEEDDEEDDEGYQDDYAEDYAQEPEAVLVEDAAQARSMVARRFLDEDLGLDINLEEFETTFGIGVPAVQVATPEGASQWLGDQVAHLVRQANAALAQSRSSHEQQLRALYVGLMSKHADSTSEAVSLQREGSKYKKLKDAARSDYQARLDTKDEQVRQRRSEIVAAFDKDAESVAEEAAAAARSQFKRDNRGRLERAQNDAVREIETSIEAVLTHADSEILRVRRQDAQVKMAAGQTQIFEIVGTRQSEFLEEELSLLKEWEERITSMIDDYRKDDVARVATLAQQQATEDQVARLRAEHEANLDQMRGEHADRVRRAEEELERVRADAVSQMKARDEEWNHALELEKAKTSSETTRAADLMAQLRGVKEEVGQEYVSKIAGLEADRKAFSDELARASEMQSRSNKILTVLMVCLALVMLGAGFILGASF